MKKYINLLLENSGYILAMLFVFMAFLTENIFKNGTVNITEMLPCIFGICLLSMNHYIQQKILG
ncbi:hypothetical protein [Enterobacter asburiae]|nr:hypothetical protein [Escherichia coli]EIS4461227.1 hypothetical protein [Salmonella enterica]EJG8857827.1 hypothetical protein [Salmonella enterica]